MFTLIQRARRRLQDEEGFTLIEMAVTVGILLVVLLSLAYTAAIAFTDISLARQREGATGLANQTMEQVRALPFDTVKKGLDNTDLLTADPNITVSGGVYSYGGEEIPRGDNAAVVPLVPHRANVVIGPNTYHRSVYVTYFQNNKTTNEFRVTVIVSWDNPARRGTSAQVQIQTVVFSPAGCLSTATHPFAAPCQPFLYGTSQQEPGAVTITGTIDGIDLDHAALVTTRANSSLQVEQTSSIIGTASTSGVELQLNGDAVQTAGKQSVTSGADSDPSTPGIDYQNTSLPSQGANTLSATGNSQTLSVTSSANDVGATTSTTTALAATHPCADHTGSNQNDSQPCGNTNAKQAGNSTASLQLSHGGTSTLATLGSVANATVGYTNRDVQTTGDGWVHSELYRYLGTLSVGGLPSGLGVTPSGWNGYYVRVSGFSDSVTAEDGAVTAAPTVSQAGTISYWNGSGYTSLTLSPGAAVNVPVTAIHLSNAPGGSPPPPALNVDITGSLTTGGTAKNDPANCGNSCARTTASATSNGPLVGTVSYTVTYGGSVIADLIISIDFGSITSSGTYTAAPSG